MNLKNSTTTEEMLNTELPNASFNQTSHANSNSLQWTSPTSQATSSIAQNKNFLNNLSSSIYDSSLSSSNDNHSFTNLANNLPAQSNYFTNSNLINLNNQEAHQPTSNLQLNDESKAFANNQFASHYYNPHSIHHPQPILNNSLANNSNVCDFTNELATNGQKSYLDHNGISHVVNTTNNFHHYNISLHHPNHLQLDNNLVDQNAATVAAQNNNNNYLNSPALPLNSKKRKKDQTSLSNKNCPSELNKTPALKNTIKKEPNSQQQLTSNQVIKEETKQANLNSSLNRSFNLNDNYTNYDYFSAEPTDQTNYSSNAFLDVFQSIKFYPFQQNQWHTIYDDQFNKL